MRPAQRRRINDRFMRFDNEDRHQEKKLYASSDDLYDLHGGLASKLVSLKMNFSTSMLYVVLFHLTDHIMLNENKKERLHNITNKNSI